MLWWSYTRSQKHKSEQLTAQTHKIIDELKCSGTNEDVEKLQQLLNEKKRPPINVLIKRLVETQKTTWKLFTSKEFIPLALVQFTVCGLRNAWFTSGMNSALAALSFKTTGVS